MSPLFDMTDALPQQRKALKIIAKSLFRELKQQGYDSNHIVSLSSELLSLVTTDLSSDDQAVTAS